MAHGIEFYENPIGPPIVNEYLVDGEKLEEWLMNAIWDQEGKTEKSNFMGIEVTRTTFDINGEDLVVVRREDHGRIIFGPNVAKSLEVAGVLESKT